MAEKMAGKYMKHRDSSGNIKAELVQVDGKWTAQIGGEIVAGPLGSHKGVAAVFRVKFGDEPILLSTYKGDD